MSKSKTKTSTSSALKELQKKCDELQVSLELAKADNKELKDKLKAICKKIVDNTDMSEYSFMDANIEPDQIETNDLLHMIQKLALLASQITSDDNIENHVEALELRITELTNENSSSFKNKLKLQERLEFIMQERDVWKRNAETLKKMYAKLVKEKELKPQLKSNPLSNKCTIGTYRSNIDSTNPLQRTYSAAIPKDYLENIRNSNITNFQLDKVDQLVTNQISQIQVNSNSTPRLDENELNEKIFFIKDLNNNINNNNLNSSSSISDQTIPLSARNSIFTPQSNVQNHSFNIISFPNLDPKQVSSSNSDSDRMSDHYVPNDLFNQTNSSNSIGVIERPITSTSNHSKKIVSFNNDIDVRIFRKSSKNLSKIVDSYMQPINQQQSSNQAQELNQHEKNIQEHSIEKIFENQNLITKPSDEVNNQNIENFLKNRLLQRQNSIPETNFSLSSINKQALINTNNFYSNSNTSLSENRYPNRTSASSTKKIPGETPVKDLEPTLKMIIIKELSVEKIDGKDWRMFALRVGISENEIKEWVSLKLQYPMARVLSFWSSRPEATIRILHRHLNAPCFNYGALAKRIENFYDVI